MAKIAQAGAIAFKVVAGSAMILVVQARQDPNHWIFPKGHVEDGESEEVTALRELSEETGVEGELIGHVGALEFPSNEDVVHVQYYLIRYSQIVESAEGRELRWCTYGEAQDLLTFSDAKELLTAALPLLKSQMR